MMTISEVCAKFPLLCPSVSASDVFHGFITVGDTDHEVYLQTPNFPSPEGLTLSTDTHLAALVSACQSQLTEARRRCSTVLDFLVRFQQICSSKCEGEEEADCFPSLEKTNFNGLLSHLEAVGWSKISEISSDFSVISIKTRDERGRQHILRAKVAADYPQQEPHLEADLPTPLHFTYDPKKGLLGIVGAWEEQVRGLQEFWDVMDELDESALVLDPPNPSRRHTTRRILFSNHVSMQLRVSVAHPRSLPQCHLLGTSHLTAPLNARLTDRCEEWDVGKSIVGNLEEMLEVEVVGTQTQGSTGALQELSAECVICYSLHLDDALPDHSCDNCSYSFHFQCLYEWLCGLTNSRQSMNVIFGECPYCTQLISCKIPA